MVFLPSVEPERLREVAQAADDAGLEELWLWEDCFFESGIAAASAALAWTEHLSVGIGLLPVPLRNVAITAMEIATLQRLFPQRVRVGVGHGVQSWMGQVGARHGSPLTLLREHLTALRGLLGGEEVTVSGRYVKLDRVSLAWPPHASPELLAGATGPLSLQLAGQLADGTILTGGTNPEGVRRARALIEASRAAGHQSAGHQSAGHQSAGHHIVVYVAGAFGAGSRERLERQFQAWGQSPGEGVGVAGDAPEVAQALGAWVQAGAGTIVLQPTSDEPDMAGYARFVARELRPLLSP